jgi:hypothetical protein
MDASQAPWLFAVLGFIFLGVAIAYSVTRNRRRTASERRLTEAGTAELYREKERRPGRD